ncbi:HAD family hydrolase [Parasphingorhabdus pacifica]
MTAPGAMVARSRAILLDFDGPVCAVFGGLSNTHVAAELRAMFDGSLPDVVNSSSDPFDVLGYAAQLGGVAEPIERRLSELEVEAVRTAPPTSGAADALALFARLKLPVVIVSNNSDAAIRAYLNANGLSGQVAHISARTTADPNLLKPNPFLLQQAICQVNEAPADCLMIGDSVSDIEAAHSARTPVVGFANKPGKRARMNKHQPDVIIDDMSELVS